MNILEHIWLVFLVVVSPLLPGVLQGSLPAEPLPSRQTVVLQTPAPLPVKQPGAVEPVVGAKSALLVDLPTATTLFAKEPDRVLPIASLTKLMTALVVVERTKPDDLAAVPKLSTGNEESRMGLSTGEQLRVEDLLAGLLIASANDAAVTLADKVGSSEDGFVKIMNDRAEQLGLADTHFDNASGYGQGENVSTTKDLSVLSRAALAEPRIRQLVSLKELTVKSVQGTEYPIATTDELLGSYLPIGGLKTGTSDAAGPCLISLLSAGDRQVLAVVLNSPARFQENKSMLDWSLRAYRW